MPDPFAPSAKLLVKLGSGLVHAQEFLEPGGHPLDAAALESIMSDPEVKEWLDAMSAMAMLPVKRSA